MKKKDIFNIKLKIEPELNFRPVLKLFWIYSI